MSRSSVRRALWVVWLPLLAGCPGPATYPPVAARGANDALVMTASGMTFPTTVGEFHRVMPQSYNPDGSDVSVGYVYPGPSGFGGVSATVYVYPAPTLASFGSPPDVVEGAKAHLARSEFDRREAELVAHHPDAQLLNEQACALTQGGSPHAGWRATYTYTEEAGGVRGPSGPTCTRSVTLTRQTVGPWSTALTPPLIAAWNQLSTDSWPT